MRVRTIIAAAGLVLAGLAGGWFAWKSHVEDQYIGRGIMYARAADEALAWQATATTPALFEESAPPWTAPRQVPCPLTAAQLRTGGPITGSDICFHFVIGIVRDDWKPALCRLAPCLFLGATEADWRDPQTRAALESLKRNPSAPCQAARRYGESDWGKTKADLWGDCSGWRWLKGPVFLAVWPDRKAETAGPADAAPPQLSNRPPYRFVRLL